MDQHDFVRWAQRQYDELGIIPTLEAPGTGTRDERQEFEAAHYPLSRKSGNTTIPLHWLDHAIQGLWQTEQEQEICYFPGVSRAALYEAPGYFPLGWFEACDLYDKWQKAKAESGFGALNTNARSRGGKTSGRQQVEQQKGIHDPANRGKGAEASVKAQREGGTGFFDPTTASEAGKKGGAVRGEQTKTERWISTADGYTSTCPGVSHHNRLLGFSKQAMAKIPAEMLDQFPVTQGKQRFSRLKGAELESVKAAMKSNLDCAIGLGLLK